MLLFPNATRLPYQAELRDSGHISNNEPYELKEFAKRLPSLPWSHKDTKLASLVDVGIQKYNHGKKDKEKMVSEDALFEATRHHLYRRAYAEGTTDNITEDYVQVLLETENQLLSKPKSMGDVKSKAKRMTEYMQDEFVIYDTVGYREWSKEKKSDYIREYRKRKGITIMGRTEHMKKVNANKNMQTQAKIKALFENMFAPQEIRKKNGKPNIGVIAKELDMHRDTIAKHLKAMKLI